MSTAEVVTPQAAVSPTGMMGAGIAEGADPNQQNDVVEDARAAHTAGGAASDRDPRVPVSLRGTAHDHGTPEETP